MRHSLHLLDVKPCSEAHLIYQAGFLTYGYQRLSSPSHMYDWVMQWDFENRLSEYSDRIAQDSHLIPFSHLAEEPSEHLIPYMELYISYYSSMYIKVNSFLEVSHNK